MLHYSYIQTAITKPRFPDYLLMLILLCVSGNPVFMTSSLFSRIACGVVLGFVLLCYAHRIPYVAVRRIGRWSLFLGAIFSAQLILFNSSIIPASVNYIVKLALAILVAYILRANFGVVYLKVISGLALVSIVFFCLNVVGIVFPPLVAIDTSGDSLVFYNQMINTQTGLVRNAGMFWEPGAFAGYLILAFLPYTNHMSFLWARYRWRVIVILVALLTTLSTTGYIVCFILFITQLSVSVRNKWTMLLVYIVSIPLAIYAYFNLEFLNDKISDELERTSEMTAQDINFSRTGSMIFDWHYIRKHPIIGNGLVMSTRYADHLGYYDADDLDAFSNGFTGNIACLGITFMLAYLATIYRNRTIYFRKIVILIVVLLLQGEYFLNYPMFMTLPFIDYNFIKDR